MSIISINTRTTGLVGDSVNPRRCTMVSTDNLATITAPGYINQKVLAEEILPTDIFDVIYNYNTSTKSGNNTRLQVSISNGVVTLFSSSQDLYITVPISSDEFKGMFAAPKLLIPAPGDGFILKLNEYMLFLKYNGTLYANGGDVQIHYSVANDATVAIPIEALNFIVDHDTVYNTACEFDISGGEPWYVTDTVENNALMISNLTGAFTDGNSDFLIHLWYSVVPIF